MAGNVSFFLTFSISFSATFGYNVLNTVPHVTEIEIEKVRKKDVTHGGLGGFVSCPYSFPQHCIPYRLSVGVGLFTNPYFWFNKNT